MVSFCFGQLLLNMPKLSSWREAGPSSEHLIPLEKGSNMQDTHQQPINSGIFLPQRNIDFILSACVRWMLGMIYLLQKVCPVMWRHRTLYKEEQSQHTAIHLLPSPGTVSWLTLAGAGCREKLSAPTSYGSVLPSSSPAWGSLILHSSPSTPKPLSAGSRIKSLCFLSQEWWGSVLFTLNKLANCHQIWKPLCSGLIAG